MKAIIHEVDVSGGIECGGYHYPILSSDRARAELHGAGYIGQCAHLLHEISVDNSLDPVKLSETFIHECMEAINNIYLDNSLEHKDLSVIANGFHQVMESLGVRFVVKHE